MTSGIVLMHDKEIAPYLDKFPHWIALQTKGIFEKEKALLCTKNWKEGFLSIGTLTHQNVFEINKYPSIVALKKYLSKEHLDSLIVFLIQDFIDNYSKIDLMKPPQIKSLTRLICDDFHYLTLGDFRLFFDNMLRGKYGKIYGRLDIDIFMESLGKYAEERSDEGRLLNLKNHSMLKKEPMIARKDIVEQLGKNLKMSKSEHKKPVFNDVHEFAKRQTFNIEKFTSACMKSIKYQYGILELRKDDKLVISEFNYQDLWLNQLLSYVNKTDTSPSKPDVFEMMKTMEVEI
jgi:hypothetical protein